MSKTTVTHIVTLHLDPPAIPKPFQWDGWGLHNGVQPRGSQMLIDIKFERPLHPGETLSDWTSDSERQTILETVIHELPKLGQVFPGWRATCITVWRETGEVIGQHVGSDARRRVIPVPTPRV